MNNNHRQAAMRGARASNDSATLLSPNQPASQTSGRSRSPLLWKRFHCGAAKFPASQAVLGCLAGAVDSRTISSMGRPSNCTAPSDPFSTSKWTACSVRSLIGCRTVVSGGQTIPDSGVSSNPVTEISVGMSSPARWSASMAPAAMSSLAHAIAVTGTSSRNSCSTVSTPDLNVKSPVAVHGAESISARRNASRKPS